MIKYWGTLLILGLITFPMTSLIMNKFDDRGWAFSKIFGLVLPAVILWNLSYLKILKFTSINAYIIIGIIAIINIIILIKKRNSFKSLKQNWSNIAILELIFLSMFMIWVYIRSFTPTINSATEPFMNYGFINKLMNSEYLPAEDIWLSGNSINYYYFGHYASAFLSKISFTGVEETYNLMLALIAALLFVFAYSIGKNLGNVLVKNSTKKNAAKVPIVIGILAGLAITIGGTLHYTIYHLIIRDSTYYYADSYTYIGTKPDTSDKGITTSPSYTSVAGDLHAHHIDTIFAFTTLALLLQYLLSDTEKSKIHKFLNPNILLLGVMLGIQAMTNYWDLPIYGVIISAIVIIKNIIKYKDTKSKVLMSLLHIVQIAVLEIITTFLFSKNLYISATEVRLTHIMSPLYKLLVLWGLPTLCIIIEISVQLYKFFKDFKGKKGSFLKFLSELNLADLYIIVIGICAIGLIILPEIVYLKDIYSDEYKRSNTMFKLTYNASLLFSITTSYILIKYMYKNIKIGNKVRVGVLLLLFITTFGYGINAIGYSTNHFKGDAYDLKANAEKYIADVLPDDYEAIQWIKQNIDRDKVILEVTGVSYDTNSRISVFTGNSTLLGWHGHEWVWRATRDYQAPEIVSERWTATFDIYQTASKEKIEEYIQKYNISYIYIGNLEYQKIENINLSTLLSMGEIVYSQTEDYVSSPVYIIKVQ